MKKLKVGLLMDTILHSDAGVQQIMKGLARYLLSAGHDIKFIVPDSENKGEFKGKIISMGFTFNPFFNSTSVPQSLYVSEAEVINMLNRERFDVIHAAIPYNPFFGAKVIENSQCPVVATFMSYFNNDLYRGAIKFLNRFLSGAYNKIDWFIAPTPAANEEGENMIPVKFNIIPHAVSIRGVDKASTLHLKKYCDGKFNLLFLGRLENRKGCLYLLKAYEIVQKEIKNIRLIIAGDGPKRHELETFVKARGLKNVIFEGYINETDKANYYSIADLCVFPSIYGECFGVVLIESMLSGKVPLVFGNEGYSWVMRNIPDLIVKNRDYNALSDKIIYLINNSSVLKNLEKMCINEASQYNWDVVGSKILHIYETLT